MREKYNISLVPKSYHTRQEEKNNSYQEQEFAPAVLESVTEPAENLERSEFSFNEDDLDNFNGSDNDDKIAKQGSMNNIFGKPYSDN